MSRKYSLPDSLEMLLDTMCNTFGGIMFIAISLVIISQLMTSAMRTMTPEEINEERMERLHRQIEAVQQEIRELKQKELELLFQPGDMSADKVEVLKKLFEQKEANLQTVDSLERLTVKLDASRVHRQRLQDDLKRTQTELKEKRKELQEKRRLTDRNQRELQQQIAQLSETLKNHTPREMRFAREESTSLPPYWVLLKDDRIYRFGIQDRPLRNEVDTQELAAGKTLKMIPRQGTVLSASPETELDYLFKDVSPDRCFISLVMDFNSFSTLLAVKQYLREKKFRVRWSVNPEFEFIYSTNVDYRASE